MISKARERFLKRRLKVRKSRGVMSPHQVKKQLYEKWMPVVGYEGFYVVSNMGRVARILKNGDFRLLNPRANEKCGCRIVRMSSASKGTSDKLAVSTIVAMAFLGMKVNQRFRRLDGDLLNDRLENLEVIIPLQKKN